ncbi:MAG: hypothetical protein ACRDYV_12890, partial [Acidimicrobiia bacterium]
ELGRAAARLGSAASGRLDRVEARRHAGREAVQADLDTLGARVTDLEERLGHERSGDGAGPGVT